MSNFMLVCLDVIGNRCLEISLVILLIIGEMLHAASPRQTKKKKQVEFKISYMQPMLIKINKLIYYIFKIRLTPCDCCVLLPLPYSPPR